MDNTKAPQRRTSFLLRQVIVPGWAGAIILIVLIYTLVDLLIHNPKYVIVGVVAGIAFGALVATPLRRRAGQATPAEQKAQVDAEHDRSKKLTILWRHFRTYQVWQLAVVIVCVALVLLDLVGINTP